MRNGKKGSAVDFSINMLDLIRRKIHIQTSFLMVKFDEVM